MKRLIVILILISFFLGFKQKVIASGFSLKSIGPVDTSGRQISHWWFSGSTVVFNGEAPAESTVTVKVDEDEGTTVSDSNNNWSYSAGTLTDGDHAVIISNNGSTINFTLTTGAENVNWETVNTDSETTTLPAAGVMLPTVILSTLGSGLLVVAKKILK